MRRSKIIGLAAALVFAGAAVLAAPQRVVSLNVCTDQLALLLAAPGQLTSVSLLSRDPRTSAMVEAARALPTNSGKAEDIVLLDPDLVLAGTFTTRATVSMLERLGYRVEVFAPINSLNDARANIARMGALLGQENRAAEVLAQFDARLAALTDAPSRRPRVALYYALGNTAGRQTLPGDILFHAGMDNIAEARGLPFGGRLPLEELVLDDPDLILIGRPYGGHSRATELLDHPVLRDSGKLRRIEDGAAWVCELPQLLDAVAEMRAIRQDWEDRQ
ncbi:ABC transporter substrate-binding protein [Mesobacterium sp. TK19101]|uniref:ABC transporter substrate-binding protein n=1 Tax=Mesobacterium hydrothermale TaxID=3111907 RepID=A0ABU6HC59_9RHOB|nr:ABC transporter substrate-binding protein [Mesobacterium sp. TK19101]MEC3859981.1 ABC transporter substrate-binding protein [Mesobacterium sp. TK19101]